MLYVRMAAEEERQPYVQKSATPFPSRGVLGRPLELPI